MPYVVTWLEIVRQGLNCATLRMAGRACIERHGKNEDYQQRELKFYRICRLRFRMQPRLI